MTLDTLLAELDAKWRFTERSDLQQLVNWSSTRNAPVHRWFRYREAYSPELIDALDLKGRILDPFCGCGSLLIGAAARGRDAVGIDLNPLATFVAKAKLEPLSYRDFADVDHFCKALRLAHLRKSADEHVPALSIARKVFEPEILDAVLNLRERIKALGVSDRAARFLMLGWLATLETVGSYFKEGNGIKYRNSKRQPGRYVKRQEGVWQRERFGSDQAAFVLKSYRAQMAMMLEDAELWRSGWRDGEVHLGNALELDRYVQSEVDSIVFSPPYANRFDYFESMKVELWFGEFVSSSDDLKRLRKASMRSHLGADLSRTLVHFPILEELISRMDRTASSWRMGVPNLLRGYFSDIVEVLKRCRSKLTAEGTCSVVVGNSAFGGVIFPADSLTALAGIAAGFSDVEILVARHLTVSPQQRAKLGHLGAYMRESVVVLKA